MTEQPSDCHSPSGACSSLDLSTFSASPHSPASEVTQPVVSPDTMPQPSDLESLKDLNSVLSDWGLSSVLRDNSLVFIMNQEDPPTDLSTSVSIPSNHLGFFDFFVSYMPKAASSSRSLAKTSKGHNAKLSAQLETMIRKFQCHDVACSLTTHASSSLQDRQSQGASSPKDLCLRRLWTNRPTQDPSHDPPPRRRTLQTWWL